jgi:DNA invertase Pin-like site-specific DNA recombinase
MTSKVGSTRCAIYTRKSTEEGLDQEFNSLDAQREACAAYVMSQRHEGWALLPDYYDDGGFTGGNMDRPGLKRLLADVRAGKIDVIVVYKVDRLTRALSDFARIVEILDGAGASFVSITQSFNTTTSMGRLTLNVLLSFAQFEREVIAERVRDKIAASKRKGMWMGGPVPLGYDVVERKLIPNPAEAETVRHIMRRYIEVGSVRALMDVLKREGVCSKPQIMRDGRTRGGIPFVRGPLYCLLKNPIYIGRIPHRKASYPGQHEAIVPQDLWEEVQALLAKNGAERKFGTNAAEPSLLAGMISDGEGRVLTPSHANKNGRRYRYYTSPRKLGEGEAASLPPTRIPAGEIEKLVIAGIIALLADRSGIAGTLANLDVDVRNAHQVLASWSTTGLLFPSMSISEQRRVLTQLDVKLLVTGERVEMTYDPAGLRPPTDKVATSTSPLQQRLSLPVNGYVVRRGQELRLVYPSSEGSKRRDPRLLSLIAKGYVARAELEGAYKIGAAAQIRRAHLARLARVSYLAPDIVKALLHGKQPFNLTARQILKASDIPLDWSEQRRLFGFSQPINAQRDVRAQAAGGASPR